MSNFIAAVKNETVQSAMLKIENQNLEYIEKLRHRTAEHAALEDELKEVQTLSIKADTENGQVLKMFAAEVENSIRPELSEKFKEVQRKHQTALKMIEDEINDERAKQAEMKTLLERYTTVFLPEAEEVIKMATMVKEERKKAEELEALKLQCEVEKAKNADLIRDTDAIIAKHKRNILELAELEKKEANEEVNLYKVIGDIAEKEHQLKTTTEEIEALETELEQIQAKHILKQEKHRKICVDLKGKISAQEKENEELKSKIKTFEENLEAKLSATIAEVEHKNGLKQKQLDAVKLELKNKLEEIKMMKVEEQKLTARSTELQQNVKHHEQLRSELENRESILKTKVKRLEDWEKIEKPALMARGIESLRALGIEGELNGANVDLLAAAAKDYEQQAKEGSIAMAEFLSDIEKEEERNGAPSKLNVLQLEEGHAYFKLEKELKTLMEERPYSVVISNKESRTDSFFPDGFERLKKYYTEITRMLRAEEEEALQYPSELSKINRTIEQEEARLRKYDEEIENHKKIETNK